MWQEMKDSQIQEPGDLVSTLSSSIRDSVSLLGKGKVSEFQGQGLSNP